MAQKAHNSPVGVPSPYYTDLVPRASEHVACTHKKQVAQASTSMRMGQQARPQQSTKNRIFPIIINPNFVTHKQKHYLSAAGVWSFSCPVAVHMHVHQLLAQLLAH
jgi:hypothetical protein